MLKTTILLAVIVFVIVTLILVALLLFIKTKLTPSGTVKININEGSKIVEVTPGGNLLSTLAEQKIFLPSACGGKGACGQCKCRVTEGG
ncbi:MAG: 2Fe-2S iron-sulfur cluster binding domain-containing protein, partial [Bacteroidales bacterium]|nr:2Fe-2S iron-sulfur cluster binding domain-containing protein [Bacteroidales bacterium]